VFQKEKPTDFWTPEYEIFSKTFVTSSLLVSNSFSAPYSVTPSSVLFTQGERTSFTLIKSAGKITVLFLQI
jgi:hypothetical protein